MEIHEQALRQLFASPFGSGCGEVILDGVSAGQPLVVDKANGEVVTCAQLFAAIAMLKEFGWVPPLRGVR